MNLQEETRRDYTISAQMKSVWNIQIIMLKKLLDVCERNGLRIWADGGTLLGTIREHGYIPWDDDIDMLMFREDYDKLVSIAEREFKDPFFFQCAYTEKNYYRGHAQIRYQGTSAIRMKDVMSDFNQGIFIDIFVYDSIPDEKDQQWYNSLKRADEISEYLHVVTYKHVYLQNIRRWPTIIKALFYTAIKGKLNLFKEYEDLFRRYRISDCETLACPCFDRNIFKTATKHKSWYDDTLWMDFEDIKMPVPINYDMALKTQYGPDYMTPRKAPSMHGELAVLDTKCSYKDYLVSLRRRFFREAFQRVFKIRNK